MVGVVGAALVAPETVQVVVEWVGQDLTEVIIVVAAGELEGRRIGLETAQLEIQLFPLGLSRCCYL